MSRVIYIEDLESYQKNKLKWENHPLLRSKPGFDLELLPSEAIKIEMKGFIEARGKEISPLSLRSEIWTYRRLCKILNEEYPNIQSFYEISREQMDKSIRKWIIKNRKNLTQTRIRTDTGKKQTNRADIFRYVKLIYNFFQMKEDTFCFESDCWRLEQIPILIKVNLTKSAKSISFKKILQKDLRMEVKQAIYMHLSQKALGTVQAEITAINRFSSFLQKRYKEIRSIEEVDREVIEEYLIYLQGEGKKRQSYRTDLFHLKSLFITMGKIFENESIEKLFFEGDIVNDIDYLFKVYTDGEIRRLNAAIVKDNVQIARVLFLQQLLGTRISEILTLKRDSIFETKQGKWMIQIEQVKSRRCYKKPISEEIKKIFEQACADSERQYGDRKYVFVKESDPDLPMQYGVIQYHLTKLIRENDLRDDHGERFKVGTHIWRHCYATRLTELHVDDVIIAKLLGHVNTASLRNYRRIGNCMMAEETKMIRDKKDEMMNKLKGDWNTDEM